MNNSEKIEHRLRSFGIMVSVAHDIHGYSSDTFLLEVSAGVKIGSVRQYQEDIASTLSVPDVRINKRLTVYEGKSYLSIEIPKKRTKDLLFDPKYLKDEKLPIGIDNFGQIIHWDLNNDSTPHALVCGASGSGKSVLVDSTIGYAKQAGISNMLIFDPKRDFSKYNGGDIRVFNEIMDIENEIANIVNIMNDRIKKGIKEPKTLVVIDEFADAVLSSRSGKALDIKERVQIGYYAPKKNEISPRPKYKIETVGRLNSLEENLRALTQKGRSSGFRVMVATQRASTKVITGDTKVNFPVLICLKVPKETDSRVVLDEPGAENLLGRGDGLMNSPEFSGLTHFQAFLKT